MERSSTQHPSFNEIYIGNLSWNADEEDLRLLFQPYGRIVRVRILREQDGRSRGVGFVEFEESEAVGNAVSLNGNEYMGRTLRVSRAGELGETKAHVSTVFVGNVSYQCSENDLRELFSRAGEIKTIRLACDSDGRPKGFAHIEFEDQEGVARAIALTNTDLKGRRIKVEYSVTKKTGKRGRRTTRRGGTWELI